MKSTLPCLAVSLLALSFTADASAQTLRFTATSPGGIIATGNTLGLSKDTNVNGPGTRDSIGTFLSLTNSVDVIPLNFLNPWLSGTTSNWMQNGSTADLALPLESTVLYAELLWGGSFQYAEEDVSALLNTPVTLTMGAQSMQVTPDGATALTASATSSTGFAIRYYMRSADVTAFVTAAGSGTYSVSGVPATQTTSINSLNAAGWTLVVANRDQNAPTRNLSVFVGGSFVDEDDTQDYSVSGFCAPPGGAVEGTAVVSAIEGDANLSGDQFLIAPTAAGPFINLAGPNNPSNNFFCSQLNDETGALDTSGSYGMSNHNPAGTNIAGGRQGWDVTTVPLSSMDGQLQNGQTSAVLRTTTTGDSYMPILAAFAIDVNSPDFGGVGSSMVATPTTVMIGDTITVTSTLANAGEVAAQGVRLSMDVPASLSLVSITSDGTPGDINGAAVNEAALLAGIDEGTLQPNQARTIVFTLHVDAAPVSGNAFFPLANWAYGFGVCGNGPLQAETFTQFVSIPYEAPMSSSSVSTSVVSSNAASTTVAGPGAGGFGGGASGGEGGGSSGGEGGEGGDSGSVVEPGGCSCRTTGGDTALAGESALLVLALAAARRRRRATVTARA